MSTARTWHTSMLLPSGKVLVAGGGAIDSPGTTSVEVFDPSTMSFVTAPASGSPMVGQTATLLPDGGVLFVNGNPAELYQPPQ